MTHAFFKGLLFLAAGSVIHAVGGEQDMRKMGGLRTKIPVDFLDHDRWQLLPLLASRPLRDSSAKTKFCGGLQRQLDLLGCWRVHRVLNFVLHVPAMVHDFFRRISRRRAYSHDHGGHGHDSHGHEHGHGTVHESPRVMLGPLVILAILSVVGGWVGIGNRFENFLAPVFHSTARSARTASTPRRRPRNQCQLQHWRPNLRTLRRRAKNPKRALNFCLPEFLWEPAY